MESDLFFSITHPLPQTGRKPNPLLLSPQAQKQILSFLLLPEKKYSFFHPKWVPGFSCHTNHLFSKCDISPVVPSITRSSFGVTDVLDLLHHHSFPFCPQILKSISGVPPEAPQNPLHQLETNLSVN